MELDHLQAPCPQAGKELLTSLSPLLVKYLKQHNLKITNIDELPNNMHLPAHPSNP